MVGLITKEPSYLGLGVGVSYIERDFPTRLIAVGPMGTMYFFLK